MELRRSWSGRVFGRRSTVGGCLGSTVRARATSAGERPTHGLAASRVFGAEMGVWPSGVADAFDIRWSRKYIQVSGNAVAGLVSPHLSCSSRRQVMDVTARKLRFGSGPWPVDSGLVHATPEHGGKRSRALGHVDNELEQHPRRPLPATATRAGDAP